MINRLTDNMACVIDEYVPPATALDLIKELGVREAEHAAKTAALREWIGDNEVTPLMAATLDLNGFGELLKVPAA